MGCDYVHLHPNGDGMFSMERKRLGCEVGGEEKWLADGGHEEGTDTVYHKA